MRSILVIIPFLLTGCWASFNPPPEYYQAQVAQSALDAQVKTLPVLKISGKFKCESCEIAVYNPQGKITPVQQGIGAANLGIELVDWAKAATPWFAGYYIMDSIVDAAQAKTYNIDAGGDVDFVNDQFVAGGETHKTNNYSSDSSGSGNSADTSTVSTDNSSADTTDNSQSYADSYNETITSDTDSTYVPVGGYMPVK